MSEVPLWDSRAGLCLGPSGAPTVRGGGFLVSEVPIPLTRKLTPLGPYHRPVPRVLGGS